MSTSYSGPHHSKGEILACLFQLQYLSIFRMHIFFSFSSHIITVNIHLCKSDSLSPFIFTIDCLIVHYHPEAGFSFLSLNPQFLFPLQTAFHISFYSFCVPPKPSLCVLWSSRVAVTQLLGILCSFPALMIFGYIICLLFSVSHILERTYGYYCPRSSKWEGDYSDWHLADLEINFLFIISYYLCWFFFSFNPLCLSVSSSIWSCGWVSCALQYYSSISNAILHLHCQHLDLKSSLAPSSFFYKLI